MAYLSGYSKYKVLTLTGGASGAQTNYQLKIAVSKESAMQGDFDDLRFTQADGETLIDAWAEVIVTDTSATVWVEFPTTPANTVEQIYRMYYGNSGAASNWDGAATFLNFDGFEDGSTTDPGDIWVFGSNYASSAQARSGTYSFDVPNAHLYSQSIGSYALGSSAVGMWMYNTTTSGRQLTWVVLDSGGNRETDAAQYLKFEGAKTYAYHTGSWNDLSLPFTTGWNFVEIIVGTTTSDILVNGNTASDVINRNTISNIDKFFLQSTSSTNYFDDNYVRKYAANPPTYAFGAEQSVPTGNSIWYYNMLKRRNL